MSDRRAGARLLAGLGPQFPRIQTVIADAGHESQKLARELMRQNGWKLQIVKRRERAFKITGLAWIVERSFAWLGRNRRLSKDYEYTVQSSQTICRTLLAQNGRRSSMAFWRARRSRELTSGMVTGLVISGTSKVNGNGTGQLWRPDTEPRRHAPGSAITELAGRISL
jgi:transposase